MTRTLSTLTLLLSLLHSDVLWAALCQDWEPPKSVGKLDRKAVAEASGLTPSRRWPGDVYWINDSGNKAELILSTADGKNWRKIEIEGPKFRDTEAMTSYDCGDGESCIIIGDVGDNKLKRKDVELTVIRESDISNKKVKPLHRFKFTYADGAHDVEAMAALPNGDLIFISKEITLMGALPARVYTLPKTEWQSPGTHAPVAKTIGELPMNVWLEGKAFLATAVTDAAVNAKREVLGVLTYSGLIEIPLTKLNDLANAPGWKAGRDFAHVPMQSLSQQETVTYLTKEDRMLWTSEWYSPETPIFSMTCRRAEP